MSKFSAQTLRSWERPASESEEQRISNAIRMIKEAINSSEVLKTRRNNIEVFIQGSYENNTNVRANSDIDVCVMLKHPFFALYPIGYDRGDYGFTSGNYSFNQFKRDLFEALESKFPEVKAGNKSLKITSSSHRVEADAVPTFQYRNYRQNESCHPDIFVEGIKFYSANNIEVVNYPKQHIENGKEKNRATQRRYKRLVRVVKRIRHQMIKEGKPVDNAISSFLIECLIWNLPNNIIIIDCPIERLRQTVLFLHDATLDETTCKSWKEVSNILPLFDETRKWNVSKTNLFLRQMWHFLEFK
ncbi:nucleotidyltransferase domain-containing protein [Psychrobacter celer]|uniref:nucleotidyltransferase domain-containing protein n=1 Tax=Psychrobacter celer TaxID=306572 RepID=UPI003FD48ED9